MSDDATEGGSQIDTPKKPRSSLKGLSGRHRLFCRRYTTHYNASRAASEAGFKASNASNTASLLLDDPKIIKEVQRLECERDQDLELDARLRQQIVSQVATTKITDVISWDSEGNVTLRPSDHIPERAAVGITSVKRTKDGGLEVRFADKIPAVRLSAQMDGSLTERVEHTGKGGFPAVPINLTQLPLDSLVALLEKPLSPEIAAQVAALRATEKTKAD